MPTFPLPQDFQATREHPAHKKMGFFSFLWVISVSADPDSQCEYTDPDPVRIRIRNHARNTGSSYASYVKNISSNAFYHIWGYNRGAGPFRC
jgi:hypothetical protein